MTLVQLEYIVALDTFRHFGIAAEKCFVTQPTLSMQIQKLEEELGILLFDRGKQPVIPTDAGKDVIEQARRVLKESAKIKEIINSKKGLLEGEIKIGIIPTLAPYLIPLFLPSFIKKYPSVRVILEELKTEDILYRLKNDLLDTGILVGPLGDPQINEKKLFYEPFVAYVSKKHSLYKKKILKEEDLEVNDLWLLQEGHCMRSQVLKMCKATGRGNGDNQVIYEAGSIETLKKLVELNQGVTLLPELALADLNAGQRGMVRYFYEPEPVREVVLVTHRNIVKERLNEVLSEEIISKVPQKMKKDNPHIINIEL
ncbi:hydrogen peroxide-inducible genes activator [Sporocytophaga myxococcoides]|uniref:hydrogen peroxide-inducible genes activator n=1 Tax=Sporocytophaga myxococcoides TaxID=153721 RepID=UPI000404760B|nr:hydrogen peroxide-inducible genes activator [Sporocytophaga myxococcoides]